MFYSFYCTFCFISMPILPKYLIKSNDFNNPDRDSHFWKYSRLTRREKLEELVELELDRQRGEDGVVDERGPEVRQRTR